MRNETCVETQTSKVPTRVAFLFISILCLDGNVVHAQRVTIKRGYGCGTERIDGMRMSIKRGADMRIQTQNGYEAKTRSGYEDKKRMGC